MKRVVPVSKQSKRAVRERNRAARTLWTRSPVTRCPAPSGAYNRAKEKAALSRRWE